MWDTTTLSHWFSTHPMHLAVNIGGGPHLAKNDPSHPLPPNNLPTHHRQHHLGLAHAVGGHLKKILRKHNHVRELAAFERANFILHELGIRAIARISGQQLW